jgi:hypothetical protein
MAGEALSIEQLRDFLRPLRPEVRALLVAELERGLLRGDEIPGCQLVLNELRYMIRQSGDPLPRVGNPARLFFRTFEPFLVNDAASDHKHGSRIARVSLMPLWNWICQKLMPAEGEAFCQQASQALLADNSDKAEQLTRAFQDQALKRMEETLAALANDEKARRKVAAEIGTPRGIDDLKSVIDILKARDALAALRYLAEIDRIIDKIKADPADISIPPLLHNIQRAGRGLRTKLTLPADSPWGRQLAAIRTQLSGRLKAEIEALPRRVRNLLRPRPVKEIAAGSVLAEKEVGETEALIELVGACRPYAVELGIGETTRHSVAEMQDYLKTLRPALVDGLRNAGEGDRSFRQSQLDAAARFSAKVLDEDPSLHFAKAPGIAPGRLVKA